MGVLLSAVLAEQQLNDYKTPSKHIYVSNRFYMNTDSKELLDLLQKVRRHSKKDAMAIMRGLAPEGQRSLLIELRRVLLEARGQRTLPLAAFAPLGSGMPQEALVRAKKVPYSLLLPPAMLESLKALSERDGSPVSHHIRVAIKSYLAKAR